ncbi:hypothetical protein [Pontibacillus yanchengensis]|uniref:Uncharacterized protein n=1 Tax=Pontibacillus yanchengensis Y32 TaxID=1385514 RepID=A0A0A2TAP9_9BACI|nr:hypothetical protein [Pontibacillus yanchengensis]KGP72857.1 hypothetical protein N782_10120 [Pontibacillus yanchengensis Y32]
MTKRIKIVFLSVMVITAIFLVYWYYLAAPMRLQENEVLIKRMNEKNNATEVTSIQDRHFIDKEHVFVPFKTASNEFGVSHWLWDKHEWKVINMDGGKPFVWKVDPSDPSSYVITWNIHPADQITSLSFYLMNERYYRVSEGQHLFTPGVQMEKRFSSLPNTFGIMEMPNDWAFYLEKLKVSVSRGNIFDSNPDLHFGWSGFSQNGKRIFPEHTGDVNGYNAGYGGFQFVLLKGDEDLENVNDLE